MKAEAERAAAESEAERSRKQSMDPQILDIIERGQKFIDQIRACNDKKMCIRDRFYIFNTNCRGIRILSKADLQEHRKKA